MLVRAVSLTWFAFLSRPLQLPAAAAASCGGRPGPRVLAHPAGQCGAVRRAAVQGVRPSNKAESFCLSRGVARRMSSGQVCQLLPAGDP